MLAQGCIIPTPLQESQGSDTTYDQPIIITEACQPPFGPLGAPNAPLQFTIVAEDPNKDAILYGQIFRATAMDPRTLISLFSDTQTLLQEQAMPVRRSATFLHNLCAEGFKTGDLVYVVVANGTPIDLVKGKTDRNHWELTCL